MFVNLSLFGKQITPMVKLFIILISLVLFIPQLVAQERDLIQVAPIEVQATNLINLERALPDISDDKIYAGKKTTAVELKDTPQVTTNNYRQIFSQIPGLLTSEVGNESYSSFSYRGIGDPHESFNLLVLGDGFPLNTDPYGYPAVYFTPPIESIGSIEFVRGGAALLYGPLPAGALNYQSTPASKEPWSFWSKQVTGSRNLYSTFNSISGTKDNVSYQGYFHHRHADGFRTDNSDYQINNGNIKVQVATSEMTTLSFSLDAYNSDHGEAGGVTKADPSALISEDGVVPVLAEYDNDRFQSSRINDRLRIERYVPTLRINHRISYDASVQVSAWGGYLRRYSRRQSQGSTPAFGGIADGTTNDINIQEFSTFGVDERLLQNWSGFGKEHTFTVGHLFNGIYSPFTQQKGSTAVSDAGEIQKQINRGTIANSLFAENLFHVTDDLSITPGLRLESIYQDIDETKNLIADQTLPLRSDSNHVLVPLLGLGTAYKLTSAIELYGNASQAYRPITYADAVPLSVGDSISEDLDPTHVTTYETGIRGNPTNWVNFDSSVFYITFEDQVGRVGTSIQNVGKSTHQGADFSATFGIMSLIDDVRGSGSLSAELGELSFYNNLSLLHAEFTSGPVLDNTPQYAPDYIYRTGLIYFKDDFKLQFLGSFVADHYADDGNSQEREIPSYKVWDLLTEIPLTSTQCSLVAGINNIFDEEYYSRVRSAGIEAGNPRNFYAGVNIRF
jgi:Fe(3+) dicitrate transport protein